MLQSRAPLLIEAAAKGLTPLVEALIFEGRDSILEPDDNGKTAVDHARNNGHLETLAVLEKEVARLAAERELLSLFDDDTQVRNR